MPMEIPEGADKERFKAIQNMMESTPPKEGMNKGAEEGQLCFDVNQFPELRGKKEGDIATVSVKVEKIEGTNVYASPNDEEKNKQEEKMGKSPMPEDKGSSIDQQSVPSEKSY